MNENKEALDLKLLENILEMAVENLGDIHPLIMNQFLVDHPKGGEAFAHHGGIHSESMKNTMIDWGLYCLMGWLDYKGEAMNALTDAINQHEHKQIDPLLTRGLMNSIFKVIGQGIGPDNIFERRLWNRMESEILEFLIKTEATHCA